jgi:hypothetical protein
MITRATSALLRLLFLNIAGNEKICRRSLLEYGKTSFFYSLWVIPNISCKFATKKNYELQSSRHSFGRFWPQGNRNRRKGNAGIDGYP